MTCCHPTRVPHAPRSQSVVERLVRRTVATGQCRPRPRLKQKTRTTSPESKRGAPTLVDECRMCCRWDYKTLVPRKEMEIDNIKVEILTREESWASLITFLQQETTEIRNRIRAAWATFHKHRQELTSENFLLNHRLRLFDAATSPTICYASGTWTPTKEHERLIQSTQRKMLRLIIQTKRRYKKIV